MNARHWRREDVDEFVKRWNRTPGRRPRAESSPAAKVSVDLAMGRGDRAPGEA